MDLFPEEHETIDGNGRALRRGERTCTQVLERCLGRIEEWEPRVKAWVLVDRDGALEQARALDAELRAGRCRGPMHGIPIGIKDIIDVAGLPTAAAFRPWANRVAERDATIVAGLRAAGAVIMGKTVTTQFAWIDPPVTRNPRNLERTPGGSSSGSAAAVATGMCLGAIGTQTGGSIIRPASFCGVAGLKPTHRGPHDGIVPFAPHLDHPGPIARTALDLGLLFSRYLYREVSADRSSQTPEHVEDQVLRIHATLGRPPVLGRLRGFFDELAEPAMLEALERASTELAAAGARIFDVPEPFKPEHVIRNHRTIMAAEAAAGHAEWYREHPGDYQPRIRDLVEEGHAVTAPQYIAARKHQDELRATMWRLLPVEFDAFLMPATIGPAPDPSTTGDPRFNSPWSYTGSPALSFPIGLSNDGLPLSAQLVEPRPDCDSGLIRTARWCDDVIRSARRPEGK